MSKKCRCAEIHFWDIFDLMACLEELGYYDDLLILALPIVRAVARGADLPVKQANELLPELEKIGASAKTAFAQPKPDLHLINGG